MSKLVSITDKTYYSLQLTCCRYDPNVAATHHWATGGTTAQHPQQQPLWGTTPHPQSHLPAPQHVGTTADHHTNSHHAWDTSRYHSVDYQHNSHSESSFDSKPSPVTTDRRPKPEDRLDSLQAASNCKPKPEPEANDSKSNLDLDTRIAMLLQNKDSGIAPPFLALGLGSDEDEEKKIQEVKKVKENESSSSVSQSDSTSDSGSDTDVGEGSMDSSGGDIKSKWTILENILEPLSTPPSPYISKDMYKYWHEKGKELKMEAQRREREENRERLKKLKKKTLQKREKEKSSSDNSNDVKSEVKVEPGQEDSQVNGIDDDRMSLSSLSSTEDPILHQDVPIPPEGTTIPTAGGHYAAPPPGYTHYTHPPGYPTSYLPTGYPTGSISQDGATFSWQPPPGYPPNFVSGYPGYNPGYMALPSGYTGVTQPPPGTNITGQNPYHSYFGPGYPTTQDPDSTHKSGEYHDPTIK